ncbi:MAG: CBS domain-containing protein [Chloroflexi bacterium]|nr:CBS domain-containing protein [Chloroflexota bacterium]
MKVRDVMSQHVRRAAPSDSVVDVAGKMRRLNVGVVPICEGGKLLGIITDRDLTIECVAAGHDPRVCHARDHMTYHPFAIGPDEDLDEALSLMAHEQVRRLPVTEGDGEVVGMLSLGDCAIKCPDDQAVAALLRDLSIPVRSTRPLAAAA